MKNWEDIVKEKLEGYESPLPEGSLAEFRAKRDGAAPAQKRFPLVWVLGATAAVAAVLAAVLFLRQPSVPEDSIQLVQQPAAPVAVVPDTTESINLIPDTPLWAHLIPTQAIREPAEIPQETAGNTEPADEVPADVDESPEMEETVPSEPADKLTVHDIDSDLWTASPFASQVPVKKRMQLKVAPAAGIVAGGGLLASVITPFVKDGTNLGSLSGTFPYQPGGPSGISMTNSTDSWNSGQELATLVGDYSHYRPFKTGISAKFPLTERWSLTTGLEYTLFYSRFSYGTKTQLAHYLGVPVRLDYTLASNRRLDVYVGGGVAGDVCVGATMDGIPLMKDGFRFSLLGAGGLQWNMTDRLGLFVEPEMSWSIPLKTPVLDTYRTEHPFVFTIASGLRLSFGK